MLLDVALPVTRAVLLPATLLLPATPLLTGAVLDAAGDAAAVLPVLLIALTDGVPATLAQAVSAAARTTAPAKLAATLPCPTRDPTPLESTLRKPTRSPITQQPLFL